MGSDKLVLNKVGAKWDFENEVYFQWCKEAIKNILLDSVKQT